MTECDPSVITFLQAATFHFSAMTNSDSREDTNSLRSHGDDAHGACELASHYASGQWRRLDTTLMTSATIVAPNR